MNKRGRLYITLVLVLLLFQVVSALDAPKYQNLFAHGDDEDDNENENWDANFENNLGTYRGIGCNDGSGWPSTFSSGCYFFGVEDDDCSFTGGYNDDAYGYGLFSGGTLTSYDRKKYDASSYTELHDDDDYRNIIHSDSVRVTGGQGLCGDDHYWHVCTTEVAQTGKKDKKHATSWGGNNLYECIIQNGLGTWNYLGQDKDHDSFIDNGKDDCFPYIDTVSLCQESFKSEDDPTTFCTDKQYSTCSFCINKDAKEIAGDGVDNDCIGGDVADPDDNEKACTDKNLNLKGQSYFWMSDAKKGEQCCGDDPEDFGKIFQTASGERLCLKKDAKSVGSVKKVEDIAGKTSCNGDWCAPEASNDNVDFHIFTLKQPSKEAYDIVSNGDTWQECTEGSPSTLTKPIGDKAKVANGFSCYKEGDRWSWVYCKAKAENEKIQDAVDNGIKNRVECINNNCNKDMP